MHSIKTYLRLVGKFIAFVTVCFRLVIHPRKWIRISHNANLNFSIQELYKLLFCIQG